MPDSSLPFISDTFEFALGSIVAYIFFIFQQRFTIRQGELNSRVDDVCRYVKKAMDVGADYWLHAPSGQGGVSKEEVLLMGFNHAIAMSVGEITNEWPDFVLDEKEYTLSFIMDLTGGEFQVLNRSIDGERAQNVQISGNLLILDLRKARRNLVKRWFERKWWGECNRKWV